MRSGVVSDVVYHGVHVTRKKTYGISMNFVLAFALF